MTSNSPNETQIKTGNVVDSSKYVYTVHRSVKTTSGRVAVDNSDTVAEALRGLTIQQVIDVVRNSGETVPEKWSEINEGLARMAAGNVIRRLYRNGNRIYIPAKDIFIAQDSSEVTE